VQTAALKALFRLGWSGIDRHLDTMARASIGLFRESAAYFLREVQSGDHSDPTQPRELRMPIPENAVVN
jgi:hypothetical protein